MTEAEAIRRLRDHFAVHDDGRPTPFLNKAVSMAIKALEKQIAMKVKTKLIEEEIYNAGGFTRKVKRYFCPVCDSFIEHGRHCYKCGQKLDWSEV